jgi:SAM-dependent methyltransferase
VSEERAAGARRPRPVRAPAADLELVERLNRWWRVAGPADEQPSFTHRLARPFRLVLAKVLGPQETFNSAVVQFINHLTTTAAQHQDEKDDLLDSLEAAHEEVLRYRESLAARERRIDAAMIAIRGEHEELRTSLGALQQATHQLTRTVERAARPAGPERSLSDVPVAGAPQGSPGAGATPAANAIGDSPAEGGAHDALSHKYLGFEDQFRGSAAAIRDRLAGYVQIFAGAADVLDIGCGRGEFLALLEESGVSARGIDLNDAMVELCRTKGLNASRADALSYLRAQPDGSLGGLFAAQVVEHLEPAYLTEMLDAAFDKLRPGSAIVLETINPACWFAFFESYIRDITHVRPLHPDTLKFLLVATGFQQLEIRYSAPYPEHEKLQPIAAGAGLTDSVETLNANVEKINRLLFTYLDYAAVGYRP